MPRAPKAKPTLIAPIPVTAAQATPAFLTDDQLAQLGLSGDTAADVLLDATAVYAHVTANPYVKRDELVAWAQSHWGHTPPPAGQPGPVDRLNAAIAFLEAAGKLAAVSVA